MPDFLTTKLAEVGLDVAVIKPKDLVVPAGKSFVIAPQDPNISGVTWIKEAGVVVKPKSFEELKKLIGIKDTAAANLPRRTMAVSRMVSPDHLRTKAMPRLELTRSALEIAKGYLYSDSRQFSQYLPYLKEFFGKFDIFIPVFRDVIIEKDATLIISKSVKSFYANNISIKTGGLMKSRSDTLHIVCNSLKGNL